MATAPTTLRLVIVGDGACGKTALLAMYKDKRYPTGYIPTVLDSYAMSVRIKKQMVRVEFHDTAGQEEFTGIRKLSYIGTHCFIMCYSCVSEITLTNLADFWSPELKQTCAEAESVIVGNKLDLKAVDAINYVEPRKAEAIRKKVGAKAQMQCSARDESQNPGSGNVRKVFQTAISVAYDKVYKKGGILGFCTVL